MTKKIDLCLQATIGKPKRISASVRKLIVDYRREHSRKPHCVQDRIVELLGDIPRIELFGREERAGWDIFGNEYIFLINERFRFKGWILNWIV